MGDTTFWVALSAVSAAVVSLGALLSFLFMKVLPAFRDLRQLTEHVVGVAANPVTGQDEVKGLFPRISSIEVTLNMMTDDLGSLKHEMHPNSGNSLRDVADRAEANSQKALDAVERLEVEIRRGFQ